MWFAFILVSLNHWKQHSSECALFASVVICFHFSIFEPLETACDVYEAIECALWFAFILVSLNHWKQRFLWRVHVCVVVICFHFSIFEPLETASLWYETKYLALWFAFILVSLNHWKQLISVLKLSFISCDLLSF